MPDGGGKGFDLGLLAAFALALEGGDGGDHALVIAGDDLFERGDKLLKVREDGFALFRARGLDMLADQGLELLDIVGSFRVDITRPVLFRRV